MQSYPYVEGNMCENTYKVFFKGENAFPNKSKTQTTSRHKENNIYIYILYKAMKVRDCEGIVRIIFI